MSAPVTRVKASRPRASRAKSSAMMSLHVAARAEAAPLAGDDDGAHVVAPVEAARRSRELLVDLEGEGVEPLGAVEGDAADAERPRSKAEDVGRGSWGSPAGVTSGSTTATASISTLRASGSTRPATPTRAIAG
jgi:hypothetical protein